MGPDVLRPTGRVAGDAPAKPASVSRTHSVATTVGTRPALISVSPAVVVGAEDPLGVLMGMVVSLAPTRAAMVVPVKAVYATSIPSAVPTHGMKRAFRNAPLIAMDVPKQL